MSKLNGTGAGWAGVIAMLVLAAPAQAEPDKPAANEVIGYANAERSGATTSWTLAEGVPYLFVPSIGAKTVAAVDTGAGVGAVLFQRPYFETHDTGCTPALGSDARPDLKWRGATARFSPPVEPQVSDTAGSAEADRVASLIVYRKDLGPPPGALLLNRRLTLGSPCRQGIHKTFFDRMFVPFAAPPEPARCYNLAGTHPQDGGPQNSGKDIRINFTSADRLVIMQPADLDNRYRNIRHRFRVTLYDGDGCRGGAGEFRSTGQESGDIKLAQMGLRDRVRSIRIVYEGGPLAPYYAVPAATPVAAKSPAPQPAPAAAAPTPDAPAPVVAAPVVAAPVAPAKAALAEVTPPEAVPAEDKVIAKPAPPSPLPSPVPSPPATSPPATSSPASQSAATMPSDVVVAAPAPSSDKLQEAVAPPRTPATPLLAALPAPRLTLPTPKPAAPAPAAADKTFEYPVHDIYRLNFCLRWGEDCGEPAATAWCKAQGFTKASAWKADKDIGALFPTIVLTDKRVCAQGPCDGFEEITCSN